MKKRSISVVLGALGLTWVPFLVVGPMMTYNDGTSSEIKIEVLAEPYLDTDRLKYRWSGDVERSCAVTLRRQIVDAKGYIRSLQPSNFPAYPKDDLGPQSFPVTVETPSDLPSGDSLYQVTEYASCSWLQRLFPVGFPYPAVEFTVTR